MRERELINSCPTTSHTSIAYLEIERHKRAVQVEVDVSEDDL